MKTMILAAGRGERLRPLTDHCPKPLLPAGGKALIVHLIERLTTAGLCDIVINTAHLGMQLPQQLGDGEKHGVRIQYSHETEGLETAGGLRTALPLLGEEPFIVVNGDLFTDFPFATLCNGTLPDGKHHLATLVMVPNPDWHARGDFAIDAQGRLSNAPRLPTLTYSGIGLYHPALVRSLATNTKAALAPILHQAVARQQIHGLCYQGIWHNIGTAEQLAALNQALTDGRP